jgi:hypothetical protein
MLVVLPPARLGGWIPNAEITGEARGSDLCLRVLLAAQAGSAVGEVNVELLCALNNGLALQGGHIVGDLAGILPARMSEGMKGHVRRG